MNRRVGLGMACWSCLLAVAASTAPAQSDTAQPYRAPVPGVMKDASPARQVEESYSRHDVVELLAVDAAFDWAREATFRRDIWNLRFEYKPVRMVWVDMPQSSGKVQRKAIHYLVYSVTNVPLAVQKQQPPCYGWMHPVEKEDGSYEVEYQDRPIQFVPEFLLHSPEYEKAYPDRVIPLAMSAIREREDRRLPTWSDPARTIPRQPLHNTVEMAGEIAVGQTVWGVATWEEIDPRIDRFSIFIQGLTNAYRWKDDPAKYRKGIERDAYRTVLLKTLKLNFWSPGDAVNLRESEIRRGYPGEPDYEWVYLPSMSK